MKSIRLIKLLSIGVALLALIAVGIGLFWENGGEPFFVESIRGESVKLYGDGLYKYDTYFKATINKGTDAATLFVAIPMLIYAVLLSRRNQLKGILLLTGLLSYFLYYSTCMSFGVSYNFLFPVYILMFSTSLFAFAISIVSLSDVDFSSIASPKLPYRGIAIFLVLAGLSTFVWLFEIVGAVISGNPPSTLDIYTSEVSFVLDPGVIGPTAFVSAAMLLKRKNFGYIGAAILLTLNALVGIMVISQTIIPSFEGVTLGIGELVAYVGIFFVMGCFALGLNIRLFRNLKQ